MQLKYYDVYDLGGFVKETVFIHDHKTNKANTLYLKPVQYDLMRY